MDIAGYVASVFIGIFLGLIGGGGSILTVPVLVYLFGLDALLSTTYSLFVVGTTSLIGAFFYFRRKQVSFTTVIVFGLPSVVAVFLTRMFLLPAIPDILFEAGSFTVSKRIFFLALFGILMIAAAVSMIRKPALEPGSDHLQKLPKGLLIIQGTAVGLVTGLIGAGGGFLIIPALVNFLKLPMKTAIGTSLAIISINSLTGFLFSLHGSAIHWRFLLLVSMLAIAGLFIGMLLSRQINGAKLKSAFGWFVLVMGVYILFREIS
jgi:uncharacterized membrane protein YfcA